MERRIQKYANWFRVKINNEFCTATFFSSSVNSQIERAIVNTPDDEVQPGTVVPVHVGLKALTIVHIFEAVDNPPRADVVFGLDFLARYNVDFHFSEKIVNILTEKVHLNFTPVDHINRYNPNRKNVCIYLIGQPVMVPDSRMVNIQEYPCGKEEQKLMKVEIDRLLKEEIIRPSVSPFSSPVSLLELKRKKGGPREVRLKLDHSLVNKLFDKVAYKMPVMRQLTKYMHGAKVFSTLYIDDAFRALQMNNSESIRSAFSTPFGHYEYYRMPRSFRNSAPRIHVLLESLLWDLLFKVCVVLIDTIVLFTSNHDEHAHYLLIIERRMRDHGFVFDDRMCEVGQERVYYFAYHLTAEGYTIDPEKRSNLLSADPPSTPDEMRLFLRWVHYYREFLMMFLESMHPLAILAALDPTTEWTTDMKKLFDRVKKQFMMQTKLGYPNFQIPFKLVTFPTEDGMGAILYQEKEGTGQEVVIGNFCQLYKGNERYYAVHLREVYAMICGYAYFKLYLQNAFYYLYLDKPLLEEMFAFTDFNRRYVTEFLCLINLTPDRIRNRADRFNEMAVNA